MVGDTSLSTAAFFSSDALDGRSQSLYTISELMVGGLVPGEITGLQYKMAQNGSNLKRLRIRLKNSPLSALSTGPIENTGFTEVFNRDWRFDDTGWQLLPFTHPFIWDGFSNILAD